MDTAASDIRRTLETAMNEEKVRDEPYLSATRNTILQAAALKNRDFGYYGDRHPMGPKNLKAAQRFAGLYDLAIANLTEAVQSRELKEKHPAIWRHYRRRLETLKTYVQSGIVTMTAKGMTKSGAVPLIAQADVFRHLQKIGSTEEQMNEARQAQAMAMEKEQAEAKKGLLQKIRRQGRGGEIPIAPEILEGTQ